MRSRSNRLVQLAACLNPSSCLNLSRRQLTLCVLALGLASCSDTARSSVIVPDTALQVDPAEFIRPEDCAAGKASHYIARLVDLTDPDAPVQTAPPTSCLAPVQFRDVVVADALTALPAHGYRADIELYGDESDSDGASPLFIGTCGRGHDGERSRLLTFAPPSSADSDAGTADAGTADAGTADAGTADAGTADAPNDRSADTTGDDAGETDAPSADATGDDAGAADAGAAVPPYGGSAYPRKNYTVTFHGCLLTEVH